MDKSARSRVVPCPTCKGPSRYAADNVHRPFCSARCQNIDFGAWASERFRVDTAPSPDPDEGAAPESPARH